MSREDAVAVARSFLGTPYILAGRIKGVGVDCATILALYLQETGFAQQSDFADVGLYHHDWFCHTTSERYLLKLMRHAPKTLETICRGTIDAKPGSLALFRAAKSRVFNHGGIITKWPFMIHAQDPCVREVDVTKFFLTSHRDMAIFDPWSTEC